MCHTLVQQGHTMDMEEHWFYRFKNQVLDQTWYEYTACFEVSRHIGACRLAHCPLNTCLPLSCEGRWFLKMYNTSCIGIHSASLEFLYLPDYGSSKNIPILVMQCPRIYPLWSYNISLPSQHLLFSACSYLRRLLYSSKNPVREVVIIPAT